ncbi:F-box/kelch-repeat protein [Iris pallida]|uniref:F-box/kelch-repeat protein n=1 Tax=Iris pallida TaxID=29817 RepID=A0AAX6DRD7_IRIPA|nr:F-box/kelch-repeat protein [Iris pallida]
MEWETLASDLHQPPLLPMSNPIPEEENGDENEREPVALDVILPDDILEKIFSFLPIVSLIRAGTVCRRWREAVRSGRCSPTGAPTQRPWYFMFTCTASLDGYAYDPCRRKWCTFGFPCAADEPNCFVSSSRGLICFMDYDTRSRVFVCNPVTGTWKQLPKPADDAVGVGGAACADYAALAMAVDRRSRGYTVAVVRSRQVPDDFLRWDLSVQLYDSGSGAWAASVWEVLTGWRGGDESVICDGVLYCLLYSFVGNECRHGLIAYDLSSSRCSNKTSPMRAPVIPAPCPLTCCRLMNLRDRLVMVGGIGKYDRPGVIRGVGIWELDGREWRDVARMPHRFFQGFGELDEVFASSGNEDLVYIQSFGAPALLTFDMGQKQWRWSAKCPVTKKFPLQLFTGFCFQPSLEVTP